MKSSELKIVTIGTAGNFIGAGLAIFGNIILGIILIVLGFIAIAVVIIQEIKRKTAEIIFYDDFSDFKEWEQILNGKVIHSDDQSHSGDCSLKKIAHNDPNGGYKFIGKTLKPGFALTGWIYRPSNFTGGAADRLALEDNNGNGYGFVVKHEANTVYFFIEIRQDGLGTFFMPGIQIPKYPGGLTDDWYYFEFQITTRGKIILRIDHNNKMIAQLPGQSVTYNSFSRVTVRGGNPYFVDDLKIIKT